MYYYKNGRAMNLYALHVSENKYKIMKMLPKTVRWECMWKYRNFLELSRILIFFSLPHPSQFPTLSKLIRLT